MNNLGNPSDPKFLTLWHLISVKKSVKPFQKTNLQKALHALLPSFVFDTATGAHCTLVGREWFDTALVLLGIADCRELFDTGAGIAENCQRGVSCELHKLHSHFIGQCPMDTLIEM